MIHHDPFNTQGGPDIPGVDPATDPNALDHDTMFMNPHDPYGTPPPPGGGETHYHLTGVYNTDATSDWSTGSSNVPHDPIPGEYHPWSYADADASQTDATQASAPEGSATPSPLQFGERGREWVRGSSGFYYEYINGVATGNWTS